MSTDSRTDCDYVEPLASGSRLAKADELEQLIASKHVETALAFGCMEPEFYGGGKAIRRFGFLPQAFPICCMSTHGVTLWDKPQDYQLSTHFPVMLVNSLRMRTAWLELSSIPCYVVTSPFVLYRRDRRIRRSELPRGSIAFFSHSTAEIDVHIDITKYVEHIRALPDEFQPVTVCLHFRDIEKGVHKVFLSHGVDCVSAGNWLDPQFIDRFYEIVAQFRYATSNSIGSYAFYCVEMGIPFSLSGEPPVYFNRADTSMPGGLAANAFFDRHPAHQMAKRLFKGLHREISEEQRRFVEDELGVNDSISRARLAAVLYTSIVKTLWQTYRIAVARSRKSCRSTLHRISVKLRSGVLKSPLGRIGYLLRHGLVRASRIVTCMTINELITLHQSCRRLQGDNTCVEIGSYLGASSCFICGAISSNSRLICIDTWQNDEMKKEDPNTHGEERDTYSTFMRNTQRVREKIIAIRKRSHEAIEDVKAVSQQIDFLFVDGDHNYDCLKRDWDVYSPLLPVGALVAFHNTGWAEGVQRVVLEDVLPIATLVRQLPNLQIFELNRLAGSQLPPALKRTGSNFRS